MNDQQDNFGKEPSPELLRAEVVPPGENQETPEDLKSGGENIAENSSDNKESEISSLQEEIRELAEKSNSLNERILRIETDKKNTSEQINELRSGLGLSADKELSESDSDEERLKSLIDLKEILRDKKDKLLEEHGNEAVPEGVVIESGDNSLEVKTSIAESEVPPDQSAEQETENRKKLFERGKENVVREYEKYLRSDWSTKGAINLEAAISLMKERAPEAMDKMAEEYLSGKEDGKLCKEIFIKWDTTPWSERFSGKPNEIKNMKIKFDEEEVPITARDEAIGTDDN
ncbi:MAG: hypothetical protein WCP14_00355 [bacterium]